MGAPGIARQLNPRAERKAVTQSTPPAAAKSEGRTAGLSPATGGKIMADGMVTISTIEIKRLMAEAVGHCPTCAARRAADAARALKHRAKKAQR